MEKEKQPYVAPSMEVIRFESADVITTSEKDNELPIMKSSGPNAS